ncbi:MAG: hypothetical protein ACON31_07955 [Candidatus Puniceispirillaceae bacterium]
MQDKIIDTGDQLIENLFADTAEDSREMTETAAMQPVIQIVHFDEGDRPADSETRPLHSFL